MSRLYLNHKGLSWNLEDSMLCNVETSNKVIRLGQAANKTVD